MLEALDRTNSYLTANDQHRVALSFDGCYDRKTYRNGNNHARFRFTWKTGLSLQSETWDYDGQAPRCDRRTAWLLSLGLEVLRNTPSMRHELELRFDGTPPLNIREGNAGLHRTDVFSAVFFYRSGNWLSKRRRNLSADARLYAYRNAVATSQAYDAATGVRTYRPENVNGNWNVSTTASFYTPLGTRGFSLHLSLSDNFYHSVDLTGQTCRRRCAARSAPTTSRCPSRWSTAATRSGSAPAYRRSGTMPRVGAWAFATSTPPTSVRA